MFLVQHIRCALCSCVPERQSDVMITTSNQQPYYYAKVPFHFKGVIEKNGMCTSTKGECETRDGSVLRRCWHNLPQNLAGDAT